MDLPDWFGRSLLLGAVSSLHPLLLLPGSCALWTQKHKYSHGYMRNLLKNKSYGLGESLFFKP